MAKNKTHIELTIEKWIQDTEAEIKKCQNIIVDKNKKYDADLVSYSKGLQTGYRSKLYALVGIVDKLLDYIAESNRESYKKGVIDAIEATKIEKKSQEIAEAELSLKKAMGLSLSPIETLNEIVKFHGFNEASEQQSRKAKKFLSKLAENDTNP